MFFIDSNRVDKIRGGWFCLFMGLGEFDIIIIILECILRECNVFGFVVVIIYSVYIIIYNVYSVDNRRLLIKGCVIDFLYYIY